VIDYRGPFLIELTGINGEGQSQVTWKKGEAQTSSQQVHVSGQEGGHARGGTEAQKGSESCVGLPGRHNVKEELRPAEDRRRGNGSGRLQGC
jgi:hypothetical protein